MCIYIYKTIYISETSPVGSSTAPQTSFLTRKCLINKNIWFTSWENLVPSQLSGTHWNLTETSRSPVMFRKSLRPVGRYKQPVSFGRDVWNFEAPKTRYDSQWFQLLCFQHSTCHTSPQNLNTSYHPNLRKRKMMEASNQLIIVHGYSHNNCLTACYVGLWLPPRTHFPWLCHLL